MSFTTRPEIQGTFGAVAATHWLAASVGMRILEGGGNAFDAAVAAGFVLQVIEPHLNGPAGDVTMLAAAGDAAEPDVICGQGPVPAKATVEHYRGLGLDIIPGTGQLATCVPGAFGAWLMLLRDRGTMTLRAVLEPAIHYALKGYPLVARIAATIASVRDLFEAEWTSSAALYLPDGDLPRPGALFRNPELAALLIRILDHAEGASGREAQIERAQDYWYRGPVAEAIDRFSRTTEVMDVSGRRHVGLLSGDDMAAWSATVERPVGIDYRDTRIWKCGGWSQGPVFLQALQLLESHGIVELDPLGPDFVHLFAEATKLAMADRDAWYGDAGDVPLAALLDPAYAVRRSGLIGPDASHEIRAGAPGGWAPRLPPLRQAGSTGAATAGGGEPTVAKLAPSLDAAGEPQLLPNGAQRGDTCHVDVVDRWGNMVSATPSGGWLQSNPVIPGLGFALNTRTQMCWLTEGLNSSLMPGRRPRTTLTPSMAFRDGRPSIAFGTPGGDQQDQWSLLFFLRHLDHGLNLQEAIDAPAFHTDHLVASFWPREVDLAGLVLEGRFPASTIEELRRRGHRVTVADPWSEGRLSACATTFEGGQRVIRAAANARGMQGYAVGR
jgi:gamma-glutamyltranspeptidase/glutathione hydrolase